MPERIAKRIARAGICSRRDAEALILAGRVKLNGKILDTAACIVTAKDQVEVDDKAFQKQNLLGCGDIINQEGLSQTGIEKGRDTVFNHLPDSLPRVISIGRLDLDSEGLLLLTNDGALPVIWNCLQQDGPENTESESEVWLTL